MRIAILVSNIIRLPPTSEFIPKGWSGAPEKIMYTLTENLVKKNHHVYLFASGDSVTSAKLISVTERATYLDSTIDAKKQVDYENMLISKCYLMAKEGFFDVIHTLFDYRSAFYAQFVDTPTISTLHSPLTNHRKKILEKFKISQFYVSISKAQQKSLPDLNYVATIYHGIDINNNPFYFGEGKKNYMIYVGRIVKEKGVKNILEVAKILKKQTIIIGTLNETNDYWNHEIKPNINNNIYFELDFINKQKLASYYQNAKIFLFPIQWEEPFGLVMIESMACGTPVVAFARGSVPEVIKDGETGFIVNPSDDDIRGNWIVKKTGIEGLCEAVERIYSMPEKEYQEMRYNCRKHVEKHFTVERMVDEYIKVYEEVIRKTKK